MNSKELKTREQIDKKYKWNIEAMICDESSVNSDLDSIKDRAEKYAANYSGRLAENAETLLAAYTERDDKQMQYCYCSCVLFHVFFYSRTAFSFR